MARVATRATRAVSAVVGCLAASAWLDAAELADPATLMLDDLRAASAARTAAAAETSAWQQERERLQVTLDALAVETARQRAAAAKDIEAMTVSDRQIAEAANAGRQLDAVRAVLKTQAEAITKELVALALTTAPGAVRLPAPSTVAAEAIFDEALRALEASERGAAGVAVELVEGEHQGKPLAVKLLRVGPVAWWCELDGQRAGTVRQRAGNAGGPVVPQLDEAADGDARQAIRQAIAIHEGRALPVPVILPAPAEGTR